MNIPIIYIHDIHVYIYIHIYTYIGGPYTIYTYIIYPCLWKDPCNIFWLLQSGKYDNTLFWERPIYFNA